jgi:uncharacterized repeat protein (TIGR03803 family)
MQLSLYCTDRTTCTRLIDSDPLPAEILCSDEDGHARRSKALTCLPCRVYLCDCRSPKEVTPMNKILTVFVFALMLPPLVMSASKYVILHEFGPAEDGVKPQSGLILDIAGNLYGTTSFGGDLSCNDGLGCGTVFMLSPNSDGRWTHRVIHAFHASDGFNPEAGLVFDSSGNLYGTTVWGGDPECSQGAGCGTVFRLAPNLDGTWTESLLHKFHGADGGNPTAGLVFDSSGNLYGTAADYGRENCTVEGCGTVFRLTPKSDGSWAFAVIHAFYGPNNGSNPNASLVLDNAGNLYGTTTGGGTNSCFCGTVFKLAPNADGKWIFSVLYRFDGSGGEEPESALVLDTAGNLYGTAALGCISNDACGTVFKLALNSDGIWTYSVIHRFDGSDGDSPEAGLIVDAAGNLYGTTNLGGDVSCLGGAGCGTVFELMPASNGRWTERLLHSFRGMPAWTPEAGLALDKVGNLYGTTPSCGSDEVCAGAAFEISP